MKPLFHLIALVTVFFYCTALSSFTFAIPFPTYPEVKVVNDQLQDGQFEPALKQIHAWVDGGQIHWALGHVWLPNLIDGGYNKDAADLAIQAVFIRPGEYVPLFMQYRTEALLNLNQYEAALQTAKGYYNVCPFADKGIAVDLISQSLAKVHPDDKEIVRRFNDEQRITSQKPTTMPGESPPAVTESVLKSIKIPDSVYAERLNKWVKTDKFENQSFYGNLLLVADRSEEAEKLFRTLYEKATTPKESEIAADGIARSLRAIDGNTARASAWLASLRKQNTPAK